MIPLPIVLGPTASGKSWLALRIAQEFGGEIVNCDSVQIYRGMDIGTAKVMPADRGGISHHLIDVADPVEVFTAGRYAEVTRRTLREIADRGRIPVVAGGAGFYLRALLEGLSPGPVRDEAVRRRLEAHEERRPGSLHRILERLDPRAAARIHSNDKKKLIRALEVRLLAGMSMSAVFAGGRNPLQGFHSIKLGLNPPREALHERLDWRSAGIFEQGLLDEVRRLLSRGVPSDAKAFESIGYKQAVQVLQGGITEEQARQSTALETRQYAKRQITWFRKEPDVHWLDGFGDDPEVEARAFTILRQQLS